MKRKEYIDATMKAQRTVPLGEVAAEVKRVLDKKQELKETMKRRIIVLHEGYGCESGCCGHSIEIDGKRVGFDFDHPWDDAEAIEFAKQLIEKELGAEHVADLDWENCRVETTDKCY